MRALGKQLCQLFDETRMHGKTAQMLAGVNLFVQGDRAAIADDGGTQLMPLHVRCQA
jgi:hypothetical protein